jgi:predicted Zn-dependent peptidase
MKTKKSKFHIHPIHGYNVLFVPEKSKSLIVQSVIHSGCINETKHTSGLNHLVEHVLVNSWKKCKGSCIQYWDNLGKLINASTDTTCMKYYVKGGVENTNQMVEYISTITTNPMFTTTTLETEKKAILEELNSSSNDSMYTLLDTFNKHFFKEEGLKYTEDSKLQIKNLNHISLSNVKQLYHEYFNPQNILFIVYGEFNTLYVKDLFSKYLIPHLNGSALTYDCFTNQPSFTYVPYSKDSYSVMIGFPCNELFDFKELYEDILNTLLFRELRTIHKLVYSVTCNLNNTRCNTFVNITFDVSLEHVQKTIQTTINCLLHYKQHLIELSMLNSSKKRVTYLYKSSYDMMDYYSEFIYLKKHLTKQQFIKHIHVVNQHHFKTMMNQAIQFDKATCVYQGKKNLNLTWNSFNLNYIE